MKNTIKRVFSCLSILAICIMTNMGIEAKAVTASPIKNIFSQKSSSDNVKNSFTLYSGSSIVNSKNDKLADHYSHYSHQSHSSHQSHYSSRY